MTSIFAPVCLSKSGPRRCSGVTVRVLTFTGPQSAGPLQRLGDLRAGEGQDADGDAAELVARGTVRRPVRAGRNDDGGQRQDKGFRQLSAHLLVSPINLSAGWLEMPRIMGCLARQSWFVKLQIACLARIHP